MYNFISIFRIQIFNSSFPLCLIFLNIFSNDSKYSGKMYSFQNCFLFLALVVVLVHFGFLFNAVDFPLSS